MKSGSIGFAAKSTSRDIGSPPKSSARPLSGPGIGLYTPPLFDLSGFISRSMERITPCLLDSRFLERETYFGGAAVTVRRASVVATGPETSTVTDGGYTAR